MNFQYCRHCETTNPAFARFCENCERDLRAENEPESSAVTETEFAVYARRTMSRPLYIGAYLAVLALVSAGIHLSIIWNAWSALDDGSTSITPATAVGLHFVPLLNLFWAGFVILAFPGAYNDFLKRYKTDADELGSGLYFAYFILLLLVLLAYLIPILAVFSVVLPFLYIAVIYTTCGAINRLAESGTGGQSQTDSIFGFDLTAK
jgi:hypothetical protein